MSQFILYHPQSVADELRGADGNLVLVLNPFLVIDPNQRVQDVFRFLHGRVVYAEIDDGGFLVAQFGMQFVYIIIGNHLHVGPAETDGHADEFVGQPRSGSKHQASRRSAYGVAHLAGIGLVRLFAGHFEIGKGECGRVRQVDSEVHRQVGLAAEDHGYRGRLVQLDTLQATADGERLVQVQTADHLGHQRGRSQCKQLVVDVGVRLEQPQVGKIAHTAGSCPTFRIVLHQNCRTAGIDGRRAEEIQCRHRQGDKQRQQEPVPLGDEHAP